MMLSGMQQLSVPSRLLVVLLLISSCGERKDTSTTAQSPSPLQPAATTQVSVTSSVTTAQTEAATVETFEPTLFVFPPRPSYLPPQIVFAKYDRFKNQWTVATKTESLDQDQPQGAYDIRTRPLFMRFQSAIFRNGEWPVTPASKDSVGFVITSIATDWQFLGDHTLRLIVDGRRYQYDTARASQLSPLTETLWADIPMREFLQIAAASQVEGQIGSQEFRIPAAGLRTLSIFASIIALDPHEISKLPTMDVSATRSDTTSVSPKSETTNVLSTNAVRQPVYEQVFVDARTRQFYPEACPGRPANTYRLARAMAVRQGFTLAPQCAR